MESISWKQHLSHADGYLRRIQKNKTIFTPDLLYNLCSMAIENYFMALSVNHDRLPHNHRFSDLIESVSSFAPLDTPLKDALMKMESQQDICSLEAYSREMCTTEDVPVFIAVTESVRNFVMTKLKN